MEISSTMQADDALTSCWKYNPSKKALWIWKKKSVMGDDSDDNSVASEVSDETSKSDDGYNSPELSDFKSPKPELNDDQVVCPIKVVDNTEKDPAKLIGLDTLDCTPKEKKPVVKRARSGVVKKSDSKRGTPKTHVMEKPARKKRNISPAEENPATPVVEKPARKKLNSSQNNSTPIASSNKLKSATKGSVTKLTKRKSEVFSSKPPKSAKLISPVKSGKLSEVNENTPRRPVKILKKIESGGTVVLWTSPEGEEFLFPITFDESDVTSVLKHESIEKFNPRRWNVDHVSEYLSLHRLHEESHNFKKKVR